MENSNKEKIILDLCGGTGAWSKPYKDAGYDVKVLTLPEYNIVDWWRNTEIMEILTKEKVYGILAAPPCTMFSRARTTAKTKRDFEGAMEVVDSCLSLIKFYEITHHLKLKFWAIENPRGLLTRFIGKPVFKFQPYDFGDRYSKETYLWGNFKEPKKCQVKLTKKEILESRNNTRKLPKIKGLSVAARRAITPAGFAKAFFNSNK